jgi:nucleoside-diphosphate-sugar epimerase
MRRWRRLLSRGAEGAILEGRPIQVFNNGEMERDFTYVDDIVEGVFQLAQTGRHPGVARAERYQLRASKPYCPDHCYRQRGWADPA